MVDEIVVGFEDAVREPVVAHKLPDVFDWIELGAFWRQRNDGDIGGHDEAGRQVPASLIDQEDGMGRARPLWRSLQDAGSSPCRPAGSGPRPCPPWGRPRRRCNDGGTRTQAAKIGGV